MFRIGEFSRIGSVTIDTLRHYDRQGLLKPAHVDPATSYRYYTAKQLQTLNRILALKEVGFSLEEIARILQDEPSTAELRGMLKAQLVLTASEIEAAQQRREQIQTRLNYLDLEENMPAFEVILKPVDTFTLASIREIVPRIEQIPKWLGEQFTHIASWMKTNKLPFGPPLTIYHNESYDDKNIDTECAFIIHDTPIEQVIQPKRPITVRQTEDFTQAASTIVTDGKYESFKLAYNTIGQWIGDHHYQIVGAPREIYYDPPQHGEYTAEIQFPVAKGER